MIISLVGKRGSGKTAALTLLLSKAAKSGRKVWCNYVVTFRHRRFTNIEELFKIQKSIVVGIDEVGVLFRMPPHEREGIISRFELWQRSTCSLVFLTTQTPRFLTLNVDLQFECSNLGDDRFVFSHQFSGLEVYDFYNVVENVPSNPAPMKVKEPYYTRGLVNL